MSETERDADPPSPPESSGGTGVPPPSEAAPFGKAAETDAGTGSEGQVPAGPTTAELPANLYPCITLYFNFKDNAKEETRPLKTPVFNADGTAMEQTIKRVCESATTASVESLAHVLLFGQGGLPTDAQAGLRLVEEIERRGETLVAALMRANHKIDVIKAEMEKEGAEEKDEKEQKEEKKDRGEEFKQIITNVLNRHDDLQDAEKNFYIAVFLLRVPGTVNRDLAITYMHRAANQGYAPAMYCLAESFLNGDTADDFREAKEWLLKAHKAGMMKASVKLGIIYMYGLYEFGVDFDVAEQYLQQVREAEVSGEHMKADEVECRAQANFYMGILCELREDNKGAVKYWKEAGSFGSSRAVLRLSMAAYNGTHGVKIDKVEALSLLQRALQMGDLVAGNIMAKLSVEGTPAAVDVFEELQTLAAEVASLSSTGEKPAADTKKPGKKRKKRRGRRHRKVAPATHSKTQA